MKRKWLVVFISIMALVLSACGDKGFKDVSNNKTNTEESSKESVVEKVKDAITPGKEQIDFVKQGTFEIYDEMTIDQLFNNYFADPKWSYFKSEDEEDIVEFTGGMTYLDTPVTALMQFTLDKETFEITHLSFNDIPQNQFMIDGVVYSILEENGITIEEDHMSDSYFNEELDANTYKEFMEYGYAYDLGLSINESVDFALELYGEPQETGTYGGYSYLTYDSFTVFNGNVDNPYTGEVLALSVFDGTLFGLSVDGSIEQAFNLYGEPDTQYPSNDVYIYEYFVGDYILEIGTDHTTDKITYLYFY